MENCFLFYSFHAYQAPTEMTQRKHNDSCITHSTSFLDYFRGDASELLPRST